MDNSSTPNRAGSKVMAGLLIVAFGVLFLFHSLGYWFPHWLLSGSMILIVVGFFIGLRHNFRHPAWIFLVVIGLLFLSKHFFFGFNPWRVFWPVMIILFGLWMILSRNRHPRWNKENWKDHARNRWGVSEETEIPQTDSSAKTDEPYTINLEKKQPPLYEKASGDDFIESVAIFGGTKRMVISKNFRGGEVVTIMGGTEINLTQADIQDRAELEITQVMGGARIIVPANWEVKTAELVAIMGGIEDKRVIQPGQTDPNKVLIIRGTSVFGGIDIRSF